MKVNGNKKNNHQANSTESKTDQLTRQAVEVFDEVPVKNFDPAKTWLKISARLGSIDKRFVTWGLAMAASFSMLIAANLNNINWMKVIDLPEEVVVTEINKEVPVSQPVRKEPLPSMARLESIAPELTSESTPNLVSNQQVMDDVQPVALPINSNARESMDIRPFSNPFISGFAKANIQSIGVSPEIGIDFKLAENYTARRREIYKLGLSSQMNFSTNDEGQKKRHMHFFVNLEYTTLNKKTNKGWTARSGYLVNPDGQLFQDTTIKVSLFRNIGKNLKVGPEVIFTNNLKKPYPAISLVLG